MLNSQELEKGKFYKICELGKNETPVECYFTVQSEDEISKILSISSSCEIENYEVLKSQINYNGKINLNVIYMNSAGKINNGKTLCTFSQKYENGNINIDDKVCVESKIVDVKIDRVSSDNVKLYAIVQNKFTSTRNQEFNKLISQDDFFVKTKQVEFSYKKADGEQSFALKSVLESKNKIKKILNVSSEAVVSSAESGNDFVVVNGELITTALFVTEEEEPQILTAKQVQEFREEIECLGARKEDFVKSVLQVKHENITAVVEEGEDSSNIKVESPAMIKYEILEKQNNEVIGDLYSVSHNLEIKNEKIISNEYLETKYFQSKIEGNVTLDSEQPRIDKLLAVDAQYLTESNAYLEENYLIVEGVAYATLIYLTDEDGLINSVQIEIPYSIKEKVNMENVSVRTLSFLSDSDVVIKRGREILFDGKIKTIATFFTEKEEDIIIGVEKVGEVEKGEEAIEIFYAEQNQTFWDIAKEGKVDENVLKMQNPTIVEPFEKIEKIIYYQKKEWV